MGSLLVSFGLLILSFQSKAVDDFPQELLKPMSETELRSCEYSAERTQALLTCQKHPSKCNRVGSKYFDERNIRTGLPSQLEKLEHHQETMVSYVDKKCSDKKVFKIIPLCTLMKVESVNYFGGFAVSGLIASINPKAGGIVYGASWLFTLSVFGILGADTLIFQEESGAGQAGMEIFQYFKTCYGADGSSNEATLKKCKENLHSIASNPSGFDLDRVLANPRSELSTKEGASGFLARLKCARMEAVNREAEKQFQGASCNDTGTFHAMLKKYHTRMMIGGYPFYPEADGTLATPADLGGQTVVRIDPNKEGTEIDIQGPRAEIFRKAYLKPIQESYNWLKPVIKTNMAKCMGQMAQNANGSLAVQ